MIYLIIFISLVIFSFIEVNGFVFEKRQIKLLYWVFTFLLILLAGTRFQIGFDYFVYKDIFETIDLQNYVIKTIEIGFAVLNYIFRIIGLNFDFLVFFSAFVAITLKANFFRQYSPYLFLALLNYFTIGVLINDMGQIRFGLAIGISLFAFKDVFFEQYRSAIFKIIFATLFHASAIVVLPIVLIIKLNILDRKFMLPILALTLPFLFIDLRGVLFGALNLIPIHQLRAKMLFYIYSNEFGAGLGLNMSFLLRILIFLMLYFFAEVGNSKYPHYAKMLQLYFYGILLYIVFNSIAEFATRSSAYFKTLDCIILPYFVTLGKGRLEKNIISVLIVAYTFWSFYKIIFSADFGPAFNPYQSFLTNWLYE